VIFANPVYNYMYCSNIYNNNTWGPQTRNFCWECRKMFRENQFLIV